MTSCSGAPRRLARRYAECWSFYNAAKWEDYKACHAAGASFDKVGLENWYLDLGTKVADRKRLGTICPGDRGEIELVLVVGSTLVWIVVAGVKLVHAGDEADRDRRGERRRTELANLVVIEKVSTAGLERAGRAPPSPRSSRARANES